MPRRPATEAQISAAKAKQAELQAKFKESKTYLEANLAEITALFESASAQLEEEMSLNNFAFVLMQMREVGFDGLPYVDMKIFPQWLKLDRAVRKGEKSQVQSITMVASDEDGKGKRYPKTTYLFHISQTDPIEESHDS